MIALIQRVKSASVVVAEQTIANIEQGLLVLVGVEKEDDTAAVERLAEKMGVVLQGPVPVLHQALGK